MTIEVRRDDLRTWRSVDDQPDELGDGDVLLRVDQFALTANNVTYAAFGDAMGYWQFFPAADGWGRVPVWGFADVERSRAPGLHEGERIYGYFPMATHLVVQPSRITDNGFVDASPHRSALPAVYNQYQRVAADATYDPKREREQSVLRPLFTTSFLLDDWLADEGLVDATRVVLASASSKTALGLAFLLSAREGVEVVGLTSRRNADFVRGVGYYAQTLTYDEIDDLPVGSATAYVDMAGGGVVLAGVHRRLGDTLRQSCLVGATHWEESAPPASDLPGPSPTFFFAPDRIVKRRADWGSEGFEERLGKAWSMFLESVDTWLTIEEHTGADAVAGAWLQLLDGDVRANVAYVAAIR